MNRYLLTGTDIEILKQFCKTPEALDNFERIREKRCVGWSDKNIESDISDFKKLLMGKKILIACSQFNHYSAKKPEID